MSEALERAIGTTALQDVERGVSADGIESVHVSLQTLSGAMNTLKGAGFTRFIDLTATDEPAYDDRFELQYLLYSMQDHIWLRVKARSAGTAPSITDHFAAANWYEREVFDMFGVVFEGHPGLTRIMMPDDWQGHPLRRDSALGGEPVEFSR
jgi:NADH-quinone oxidoreductase subunit C